MVDDSAFFLKAMESGLSKDDRIEIVATAGDPIEAMEKINSLEIDVITLDVEMPKMNGIDFLYRLMPTRPMPVIVVTSLPISALDALSAGAVDFVRKPDSTSSKSFDRFVNDLIVKIKIASIAHLPSKPSAKIDNSKIVSRATTSNPSNKLIAIGASTGGTEAVLSITKCLPADMPGIVVVQHMPPVFTRMYAHRLDQVCNLKVVEAADNMRVEPGTMLIGAGEHHLKVLKDSKGYYVRSRPGDKVSGHCPSVDVLFDSVSKIADKNAMGIILTGMGADGANGLLKMKQNGSQTICQDKESCIVYGMPQVAYNIGAVNKQLTLSEISDEMIKFASDNYRK